jgi:DNA-directed RNA polymerase subunit omega
MRIEKRISQALKRLNNDKYILAIAVGQRATALSRGATPIFEEDRLSLKYTDTALKEIACGALRVDGFVEE